MRLTIIIITTFVLFSAGVVFADTINIPADYPTIQEGIDAAVNGDTVLVAPGTYVENIDFLGKAITVKSSGGAAATVIDAGQSGSAVVFVTNEGLGAVLDGFTLTNGTGTPFEWSPGYWYDAGGGIFCDEASPGIRNCHISSNSAHVGSGLFLIYSSAQVTGCTINSNVVSGGTNGEGGGIKCWLCSDMLIENNTISDNDTDWGGGIYAKLCTSLFIRMNTVSGNFASRIGGGIHLIDCSSVEIVDNLIVENEDQTPSVALRSGGIYCSECESTTILSNQVIDNIGAGITCADILSPTDVLIEENVISGNEKCGIRCWFASPRIERNTLVENSDYGVYSLYDGAPEVIFNRICNNQGGLYLHDGPVKILNNIITGNGLGYASPKGGIRCFHSSVNTVIRNNIIAFNERDQGGGMYLDYSHLTVVNNTIYGNIAQEGGGLYCEGSRPDFINTVFWGNQAELGSQISLFAEGGTYGLEICYSDVEEGQGGVEIGPHTVLLWGAGMIESNPLFIDPEGEDFHLTYDSPCRDAADNAAVTEPEDFEGDPRIAHGTVDMGADEFYTHLYITGNQTPGGEIQGKLVGMPGTSPVRLFIGLGGIRPTPWPTVYGDLWLLPPRLSIPLVPIPVDGILAIPTTIPLSPPAPYDIPMQGLVGLNSDSLTNLCVLEVR